MTPAASLRRSLRRRVEKQGGKVRGYRSPQQIGVADCIVFLPEGQVILVEIKAPGDTIKPAQRNEAEVMGRLGHITRFIRSVEDIDALLGWA